MQNIKEPTEEQKKIIRDKGNVVVTAKPGSGKTFTIVEKINQISQELFDYQGIIAISFTRKASHELEIRCKSRGVPHKQSFYGTIDSFYINQIIIPFSRHITGKLVQFDVKTSTEEVPKYKLLTDIRKGYTQDIQNMLIESLSEGYIFLDICGETAMYILENVKEAIGYLVARYTHVFIDEYQDCGEIQHKIFMHLVNTGITGIAVGDINQAIYAFSNRYPKYLISLLTSEQFTPYQITKNHRCHKSISIYSQQLLGINREAITDDKRVYNVHINGDEISIANAIRLFLPAIKEKYLTKQNNNVAILCRSNSSARLVYNNLGLPCKLFADTELDGINSYWARFFNDFLQCYYDPVVYSVDFVDRYFNEEINSKSYQMALLMISDLFKMDEQKLIDKLPTLIKIVKMVYPEYENMGVVDVLGRTLSSLDALRSYSPAKTEEVNILSLHKSKGLEFDIVFHLDLYQWIMPPYNANDEEYDQSLNLHYVGITRAKKVCYIMQGTARHKSDGQEKPAKESEFLHINDLQDFRNDVIWQNSPRK